MAELSDQLQTALGTSFSVDHELGGGGMSRVFVATERALGRQVVVKVLPAERTGEVSIERFRREITVAARLQHPHIVPLLSTGEVAGLPYYTMPFIKGESLRARLDKSRELSVNEAIHILRDVAAALHCAHSEGVVHRDIKPDNVILSGGVAVVTDFGVAKAVDVAATEGGKHSSGLTSLGVALGTPAYMSPEQASADSQVDHRADIYSLGVLAYEMLAGASPFANRPPQQMLAAHVTEVPDPIAKRRPNVPAALSTLVGRCLEKRAADRPQSADEIVQALDAIATPSGGMTPTGARAAAGRTSRWWIGAAGAVAIAVVVLAVVVLKRAPPPLVVGSVVQVTRSNEALNFDASISPDGKFVAYAAGASGRMRIFVRQVSGSSTIALSQGLPGTHRWPRWSPDGSTIAFGAEGRIYEVPALGGAPRLVVDQAEMPAWSPDGKAIAFLRSDAIWVHDIAASTARKIDTAFGAHAPTWSPDGRRIAYARGNVAFVGTSWNAGSQYGNVAPSAIWIVNVDGTGATRLTDETHLNTSPAWRPDGRTIVYVSNRDGGRDIYSQRVRGDGGPDGSPRRITTGSNVFTLTLSRDGTTAAYSTLQLRSNIWIAPIGSGPTPLSDLRQITHDKQVVEGLSISHDGRWLAFDSNRDGYQNIFKVRFDGSAAVGEPVALTKDSADAFTPRWSPDDSELAFHALLHGSRDVFVVRADGQGRTRVTSGPGQEYYPDWAPDGQRIAYTTAVTPRSVFVVSRAAGGWGPPRPVNDSAGAMSSAPIARWSPDGAFLGVVRSGGLWLIPAAGGAMRPVVQARQIDGDVTSVGWGRDPGTILFQSRDSAGAASFWKVRIGGGVPQRVLRLNDPSRRTRRAEFDSDGRRLFFTIAADEADVSVAILKGR